MTEEIGGIIRTLLATGAGILATNGYLTQDQAQAIAGGLAALVVAVWSVLQKRKAKKK